MSGLNANAFLQGFTGGANIADAMISRKQDRAIALEDQARKRKEWERTDDEFARQKKDRTQKRYADTFDVGARQYQENLFLRGEEAERKLADGGFTKEEYDTEIAEIEGMNTADATEQAGMNYLSAQEPDFPDRFYQGNGIFQGDHDVMAGDDVDFNNPNGAPMFGKSDTPEATKVAAQANRTDGKPGGVITEDRQSNDDSVVRWESTSQEGYIKTFGPYWAETAFSKHKSVQGLIADTNKQARRQDELTRTSAPSGTQRPGASPNASANPEGRTSSSKGDGTGPPVGDPVGSQTLNGGGSAGSDTVFYDPEGNPIVDPNAPERDVGDAIFDFDRNSSAEAFGEMVDEAPERYGMQGLQDAVNNSDKAWYDTNPEEIQRVATWVGTRTGQAFIDGIGLSVGAVIEYVGDGVGSVLKNVYNGLDQTLEHELKSASGNLPAKTTSSPATNVKDVNANSGIKATGYSRTSADTPEGRLKLLAGTPASDSPQTTERLQQSVGLVEGPYNPKKARSFGDGYNATVLMKSGVITNEAWMNYMQHGSFAPPGKKEYTQVHDQKDGSVLMINKNDPRDTFLVQPPKYDVGGDGANGGLGAGSKGLGRYLGNEDDSRNLLDRAIDDHTQDKSDAFHEEGNVRRYKGAARKQLLETFRQLQADPTFRADQFVIDEWLGAYDDLQNWKNEENSGWYDFVTNPSQGGRARFDGVQAALVAKQLGVPTGSENALDDFMRFNWYLVERTSGLTNFNDKQDLASLINDTRGHPDYPGGTEERATKLIKELKARNRAGK